jgi:hypothetical protein
MEEGSQASQTIFFLFAARRISFEISEDFPTPAGPVKQTDLLKESLENLDAKERSAVLLRDSISVSISAIRLKFTRPSCYRLFFLESTIEAWKILFFKLSKKALC